MIKSRNCLSGEEQTLQGTCQVCSYGFYLIQPPDRQKNCKLCDQNAICYGSNVIVPKEGFFRSSLDSEEIIPCFNENACLGGNEDEQLGLCNRGYKSYLCSGC